MRERSDLQEERRQKSKKKPTSQKQHLTIETSLSLLLLPVQFLSSTSASMLFEFSLFLSTLIFELCVTAHTHTQRTAHTHTHSLPYTSELYLTSIHNILQHTRKLCQSCTLAFSYLSPSHIVLLVGSVFCISCCFLHCFDFRFVHNTHAHKHTQRVRECLKSEKQSLLGWLLYAIAVNVAVVVCWVSAYLHDLRH